ncbi:PREDICTED: feline leukemia virus subgroup C receptor-related protein 1-like [Priapulus caudatus]|uniref:Feline leukemia virus subgroup C receptor-related protein 1-like n=1 Tax=Priapulus caudatus TaxID=37621 RepID=A0ABM1E781_PRICU|nr:PREDICTED: feline leukemia virus subgroup C receptor-related protein 1-like [Priapulus caudatus]XP_014668052.1 PREDICTED: feline leukemia virus subgroup C receptor-related protein 1-like [Priapulus caudatus]
MASYGSGEQGENAEPHGSHCVFDDNLATAAESGQACSDDVSGKVDMVPTRLYRRRWFILALFCFYSMTNAIQWIQYSVISNVIVDFYGTRTTAVDWLSMIYMLAYIPLIIPATWLLDKKGLRFAVTLGALGNATGAWLKCASVAPDRFWVTMLGQTICAISQLFVLGIPANLAAVWFGPNEVSTACSIGVFGNQVGIALGFALPPIIVPNNKETIATNLSYMFYGMAAITTVIFFAILLVFKAAPPVPPSHAQLNLEGARTWNYFESLKNLFSHIGFILLVIAYGINAGSFYAISTLLNQIVLTWFPDAERSVGMIGLTIVLAGLLGSVISGIILDRTRKFRLTTLVIYICSFCGMIAFTFVLNLGNISIVYLCAGSLGFFMTGFLPVGFEFAAEITYPESEATSSGVVNASAQVFGIIFTTCIGKLITDVSVLSGNLFLCIALLGGVFVTWFIKEDLKRQKAGKMNAEQMQEIEKEPLDQNNASYDVMFT